MAETRVKMTKAGAVANVLPDHVKTWEEAGWKAEKPKAKKAASE